MPKIIIWAFFLNMLWEFTQCLFFYEMWSWGFWKATLWMWGAIFGDILIVLGLWQGWKKFFKSTGLFQKTVIKYLLLLALSFGASIFLEWMALYLELWSYGAMELWSYGAMELWSYGPMIQVCVLSMYLITKLG